VATGSVLAREPALRDGLTKLLRSGRNGCARNKSAAPCHRNVRFRTAAELPERPKSAKRTSPLCTPFYARALSSFGTPLLDLEYGRRTVLRD